MCPRRQTQRALRRVRLERWWRARRRRQRTDCGAKSTRTGTGTQAHAHAKAAAKMLTLAPTHQKSHMYIHHPVRLVCGQRALAPDRRLIVGFLSRTRGSTERLTGGQSPPALRHRQRLRRQQNAQPSGSGRVGFQIQGGGPRQRAHRRVQRVAAAAPLLRALQRCSGNGIRGVSSHMRRQGVLLAHARNGMAGSAKMGTCAFCAFTIEAVTQAALKW
jgi:hypothetical protein